MAAQLLTDTKIKGAIASTRDAAVTGTRRCLRDSKVRGLVLRITPKGTATWSLQFRPKGSRTPNRITLGMYPDLGLGDARDKAEVLRGDIARGIDPIKAEREQRIAQEAADTRPTFREVAIEYLHKRIRKEKNRRKLQVMFNSELLPVLGDMALEDISPEHVLVIC